MKVHSTDVLAILRMFNVAGDEHMPRHIERMEVSHPSSTSTSVQFVFTQSKYILLFDDVAEDTLSHLDTQIQTIAPNAQGEFIKNPNTDFDTYGVPYEGKDVYLFVHKRATVRLDAYVSKEYPEISRSTWQKHIKNGHVSVNGTSITSTKYAVTPKDIVKASVPELPSHSDKELPILYMDDSVVVINKPAGVLTHKKGVLDEEFTVADFMKRYTTVGLDGDRPGIVHRLDRDTSGVIICARTQEAFDSLKTQFSDRTTTKVYKAITTRHPKLQKAIIDAPIARDTSKPGTFKVNPNGKPAQTAYIVDEFRDNKEALVTLTPKTGRTHQIRVHLTYINCPIKGDIVYGTPSDRLFLHAYSLTVKLGDQEKTFTADIPKQFMV